MKKNETVRKLMTKNLHALNKTSKLSEARKTFIFEGIHHLPVLEGSRLVGMLSYSDLLRIDSGELFQQDPKQADVLLDNLASIEEVMTKDLTTIDSETTIREATGILAEGKFHSLPVVDNGEIAGIITSTDLLKHYHEMF